MKRNFWLFFLLTAVLSACGGGSESETQSLPSPSPIPPVQDDNGEGSNDDTSDDGGEGAASEGPTDGGYLFAVVSQNACGIETRQTDAMLLIHNDDLSIKEIIRTNADGLLKLQVEENQRISITLVGEDEGIAQANAEEQFDVTSAYAMTYLDVLPSTIAPKLVLAPLTGDEIFAGCECEWGTFEVSSEGDTVIPDHFMENGSYEKNFDGASGTRFSDRLCRQEGEAWPDVTASFHFDTPRAAWSNFASDYDVSESVDIVVEDKNQLMQLNTIDNTRMSENWFGKLTDNYGVLTSGNWHFESKALTENTQEITFFKEADFNLTHASQYVWREYEDSRAYYVNYQSDSFVYSTQHPIGVIDLQSISFEDGYIASRIAKIENEGIYPSGLYAGADVDLHVLSLETSKEVDYQRELVIQWTIVSKPDADLSLLQHIDFESINHPEEPVTPTNNRGAWFTSKVYRFSELGSYDDAIKAWNANQFNGRQKFVTQFQSFTIDAGVAAAE